MNPRLLMAYLVVSLFALDGLPSRVWHQIDAFIDRQFDAVNAHRRESTTQKD